MSRRTRPTAWRRILPAAATLAAVTHPLAAEPGFYYRQVNPHPSASAPSATPAGPTAGPDKGPDTAASPTVTLIPSAMSVQEGSVQTLQATSSLASPTWSLSGAPAGSSVSASGLVSIYGNDVSMPDSTTVKVIATSGTDTANASFPLTVQPGNASMDTPPRVRGGRAFSTKVSTDIVAPGAWTVTSSPADVTDLAVSGTTLSGTAPLAGGTRNLLATFYATSPPPGYANMGAVSVGGVLTVQPRLSLASAGVTGTLGTPVTASPPSPSGRVGNVAYALYNGGNEVSGSFGTLCEGLAFSTATGMVTGTPSKACSPSGLTLKAHDDGNGVTALADDASAAFPASVTAATASVTPQAGAVVEGSSVSMTASSTLPAPTYSFTGTPPAWLALNASTGAISGNAADEAADKPYAFAVKAVSGTYEATSQAQTLTVQAAAVTLSTPAAVAPGGTTTATVSTTLAGGTFAFAAYQADGTTPASDVTFSAVANGTVTVTAAASSNTGTTNATRTIVATATSPNVPSAGTVAKAASAKIPLTILPPTLTYASQPQSISVVPGNTLKTVATLSGTPKGAIAWSVQDAAGAPVTPPTWITLANCGTGANASCTVTAAPPANQATGTYPSASASYYLAATDGGTGVSARSAGFKVTVATTANIALVRPDAAYQSTLKTGSCAESATGCTPLSVASLWASNNTSPVFINTQDMAVEMVWSAAVAVGYITENLTDNCGSGTCSGLLQYWNGSGWVDVPDTSGYWTGTSLGSRTQATSAIGPGNIFAQRWRSVSKFSSTASGLSASLYQFKFGDKTGAFAP